MAGVLVSKYYSELRRESPEEAAKRPRAVVQRLRRKQNKPGWMMATEDTGPFYFAGYQPGVNPDYTARQVKHFSRNVQKRYEGPRRVAPSAVGKRLVDEEKRTSLTRAMVAGAGMGGIAWGGSRFRTLGRGLRLGATHPDIKPGLRQVFAAAEAARDATERTTGPLGAAAGRGFGHLPRNVQSSLNNVPPGLRPATSALVGAIMVDHARPVRRTSYRPVVM